MNANNDIKGASVKFPPPMVFILFMIIAYAFDNFSGVEISRYPLLFIIGPIIVLLGFLILLVSSISFKRAQTSIKPWKPTTQIISGGIYACSRNPIYLSFCIVTIGVGLTLNSLWVSLSFIPSIIVVFFMVIKKEEIYLENKFGDEYLEYKKKVRRWI